MTCDDINCHQMAECVPTQPPICRCLPGYRGDGVTACNIDPTEVSVSNYADPESFEFGRNDTYAVLHRYEVTNLGSQTVGNVGLQIAIPMMVSITTAAIC